MNPITDLIVLLFKMIKITQIVDLKNVMVEHGN